MPHANLSYAIDLSFEEIKLPPFQDVLVVARDSRHGKIGLSKSLELLVPNSFKVIETDHDLVESIFVHNHILAKIPQEKIVTVLKKDVFPFISPGEILKVDFKVKMFVNNIIVEKESI